MEENNVSKHHELDGVDVQIFDATSHEKGADLSQLSREIKVFVEQNSAATDSKLQATDSHPQERGKEPIEDKDAATNSMLQANDSLSQDRGKEPTGEKGAKEPTGEKGAAMDSRLQANDSLSKNRGKEPIENRDSGSTNDNKAMTNSIQSPTRAKRKTYPPFRYVHSYSYNKWNLCARVEQKLNVQHFSRNKRMKMLLVDVEGSKLEASVYGQHVDHLQEVLQEGKIYSFTGVGVRGSSTAYKLVDSSLECLLTRETKIEEQSDDSTIPMYSFSCKSFDKLHAFRGKNDLLIDVMALVREVGPTYYKYVGDGKIPKRDILLVDKTLQHVKLIVSDELATMDTFWQAILSTDSVVVVTALFVNSFKDFLYLCSSRDSRVFCNPPIDDVEIIRESILTGLESTKIASCNIYGANMVPVNLRDAKRITVEELKNFATFESNKCGIFEVVVTVSRIYHHAIDKLWYLGCIRCKTGLMQAPNTQFWCRKCEKYYIEGRLRYIIKIEISDHTDSHDVTVFDDVGQKLLGCSASDLDDSAKKDKSHDVVVERLRSITSSRYNLFVMVGNKQDGQQVTRFRYEINVIHLTPIDSAKEANRLLDAINSAV